MKTNLKSNRKALRKRGPRNHARANGATSQPSSSHSLEVSLSSFNPTLPLDGSLIVAEVLRDQMNALNDDIQTRATDAELASTAATLNADIQTRVTVPQLNTATNNAINSAITSTLPQTSSNSNAVNMLSIVALGYYDQNQLQEIINKVDELINALRR